jgi:hypothetical protein
VTARGRRRLVVLAAALGVAGPVVFWYLPRPRAAVPSARAAAALAAADSPLAVWIPFPHQNFGAVDDRLATLEARLADLAGAGEERIADLPRFGPFAVPPASELLLRLDARGNRSAELAVYPLVAWLARAAGRLAGNPWLAGGELPGRRGESVAWSDGRWCWRRGPVADLEPAPPRAATAAARRTFAQVRAGAPVGPLPAGLYRLVAGATPRTLELIAGEPPARRGDAIGPTEPVGWLVERPAGATAEALRGMVVWDALAGIDGVPAIATLGRGPAGTPGFDLPGEELLELVGADVPAGEVEGLRVRALDAPTLDRGRLVAPALAARLEAGSGLDLAASADVDRLAPLLERFAGHLRRIPLVGGAEAREIERAAAALAPLAGSGRATLEVGPAGAWARLTLGATSPPGDVPIDPNR